MRAGLYSLADIQAQLKTESTETKYKVAFFLMKAACAIGAVVVIAIIISELDPCKDQNAPGCPKHNKYDTDGTKKTHSTGWNLDLHSASLRPAA